MKTPLEEARDAESVGAPLTPYQRFILAEAAESEQRRKSKVQKVQKRRAARASRKKNRR